MVCGFYILLYIILHLIHNIKLTFFFIASYNVFKKFSSLYLWSTIK